MKGAGSQGGIGGSTRLQVVGRGGIVGVDHDIEPGWDIRVKGLHRKDKVKGLELVDEGVCLGELRGLGLGAAPLLREGAAHPCPSSDTSHTRSPTRTWRVGEGEEVLNLLSHTYINTYL